MRRVSQDRRRDIVNAIEDMVSRNHHVIINEPVTSTLITTFDVLLSKPEREFAKAYFLLLYPGTSPEIRCKDYYQRPPRGT